ncbi:MAG: hypothetical protein ABJF23_04260 [Bryobacteraceae bacterium]
MQKQIAAATFFALAAFAQAPGLPSLKDLQALVNSQQESMTLAKSDPVKYGWDLFFYSNWPALTDPKHRGDPDPAKQFGQPGTLVWETWKNSSETFLPNGLKPAGWTTAEPVPAEVAKVPFQPSDSGDVWQHLTGNSEVDGFPAKDSAGQDIVYEIRQNQSTFDLIVKRSLYYVQGQIAYAKSKGDVKFDWTAMEVKPSWRWLDTTMPGCQAQDYFTANAYWAEKDPSGNFVGWKTGLVGLTGLHILTKALPRWVWITFEQVNNGTCTEVKRLTPIPANIAAVNTQMQALLSATKWKNYELVGVQIDAGTAGNPVVLANTQIESAFQSRSSCLTCHAIASVATRKPTKPEDNLRMSFLQRQPPVSPPYYIGPPPSLGSFKSMDFVWSLRRAEWRK